MELIGRHRERRALAAAWERSQAGDPQLAVVWGRRRVGKTYLLTDLAEGTRSVYFTATRQDSEERQLQRFTDRLREQLGETVTDLMTGPFPDWEAALRFVARLAEHEPLLVVIDEAPRLNSAAGDFGDLVSAVWENHIRDQSLMLVLSGSAVAVMEEMLGPHGGLHRRPSVELRMDPFSFADAAAFLPELNGEEFVQAYAACGGYPLHLRRWSTGLTVEENLAEMAFSPGGLLLRDAPDILSEDLDWRGGYERVLVAMSGGARRRSRIAGRAQQRIDYTLDRLRKAGYVRQVRPIGAHASADPMYEIGDDYLAFWFAVLRDDADLIEGDQGQAVRHRTTGTWHKHIGRVLESAARDHVRRMVADGDLSPDAVVGRWWQDEVAEVDVCAIGADENPVLIGECKWQTSAFSRRDLVDLRRKAALIGGPDAAPLFAFWSRGGADDLAAANDDVRSYTCDDLVAR
ncbi:ATP-binding protein [Haloechinothrix salitolerans]|uniref:ATP-binding protein n=1 Tax=Haloechinothrix salitolerans TaxID=926830 RepID=A0ABW2C957_9PSEU